MGRQLSDKVQRISGILNCGIRERNFGSSRQDSGKTESGENKGAIIKSRCERELKKLVCTINYDGRSQIKGGDKERGSIILRS